VFSVFAGGGAGAVWSGRFCIRDCKKDNKEKGCIKTAPNSEKKRQFEKIYLKKIW
jgi:hypothetical protein